MNLPNKLTVLRVAMVPLFLLFFFLRELPQNYLCALLVFAAASITDILDGHIARKYGLVTDFGKLMDPLADKLLVTAAFCCLLPVYGDFGVISLIVILSRELIVTSIRLLAAGNGTILAADNWGKAKTITQMVWICLVLLLYAMPIPHSIAETASFVTAALLCLVVALTAGSGANYCIKNRGLFRNM